MKEEEFLTALAAAATDAGMGERGGSWDLIYFTPGKMSKKRGTVRQAGGRAGRLPAKCIFSVFLLLRAWSFCSSVLLSALYFSGLLK